MEGTGGAVLKVCCYWCLECSGSFADALDGGRDQHEQSSLKLMFVFSVNLLYHASDPDGLGGRFGLGT